MKGLQILVAFFSLFTAASLLIPSPMFPGNVFCAYMGSAIEGYTRYLSSIFNGVFYGAILWLIFTSISRRLEGEK
ncbi:MAG: hypothetical protein ACUVUE_08005 [Candidatus Bathycorpusculaceae bacterium]